MNYRMIGPFHLSTFPIAGINLSAKHKPHIVKKQLKNFMQRRFAYALSSRNFVVPFIGQDKRGPSPLAIHKTLGYCIIVTGFKSEVNFPFVQAKFV